MKLTKRILHHKTKDVNFIYPLQNKELGKQLLAFMHKTGGIGLASNQVGLRYRAFVMSVDNNDRVFFNPTILKLGQNKSLYAEGCLSYPNESVELERPDTLDLLYFDAHGNQHVETFSNLEARVIQHEVDHLDGLTMYDRKNGTNDKQP